MAFNAAFWKWFGDSKVVDANGDPLVVYHGTSAKIRRFRREGGAAGMGVYFTSDIKTAEEYAQSDASMDGAKPIVMSVYLSIENPYKIEFHFDRKTYNKDFDPQAISEKFMDKLEDQGYDGIIITNTGEYIAFFPSQIKSVRNNGTWDADDPDIRHNPPRKPKYFTVRFNDLDVEFTAAVVLHSHTIESGSSYEVSVEGEPIGWMYRDNSDNFAVWRELDEHGSPTDQREATPRMLGFTMEEAVSKLVTRWVNA